MSDYDQVPSAVETPGRHALYSNIKTNNAKRLGKPAGDIVTRFGHDDQV